MVVLRFLLIGLTDALSLATALVNRHRMVLVVFGLNVRIAG
ncbi:hypothetical protein AB0L59_10325 [Streptomyces sp. NPDC052109]